MQDELAVIGRAVPIYDAEAYDYEMVALCFFYASNCSQAGIFILALLPHRRWKTPTLSTSNRMIEM